MRRPFASIVKIGSAHGVSIAIAVSIMLILGGGVPGAEAQITSRQNEEPLAFRDPSANDLGGVGLLQTRTARFHKDGLLDIGASFIEPYRRYYITFQALPWLEATFRYTDIRNRLFSGVAAFSGGQTFKDRGADLKFRILEESKYLPQIAIGLQDGLGTGLFSGEYLAFSKRFYDFDFHFGLGWGVLGAGGSIENPLIQISDRFRSRTADVGRGGQANLDTLFSGPTIGLFGGVEWHTPIEGLSLKLEYDGNDYQSEPLGNRLDQRYPINFGAVYRPIPWLELTAAFERGTRAMFRASLRGDTKSTGLFKTDPPPPPVKVRPRPSPGEAQVREVSLTTAITANETVSAPISEQDLFASLEARGFTVTALDFNDSVADVAVQSRHDSIDESQLAGIADLIAAELALPLDRINLTSTTPSGHTARVRVTTESWQSRLLADTLFSTVEATGIAVETVSIQNDSVTLEVSGAALTPEMLDTTAVELLTALPPAIQHVSLSGAGANERQVFASHLKRSDLSRRRQVDEMFDSIEDIGFQVEAIDITAGTATLTVAVAVDGVKSKPAQTGDKVVAAASIFEQSVPESVAAVTVIATSAGVEVSRAHLRRHWRSASWTTAAGDDSGAAEADGATDGKADEPPPNSSASLTRTEKITADLTKQGFKVEALHIGETKATAMVAPTRFRAFAKNIGRAARVLANHAPPSVESLEIITVASGIETARVTVMRRDLENVMLHKGSAEEIWANAVVTPPQPRLFSDEPIHQAEHENPKRYPSFDWSVRPSLRQHVGGPEAFYLYQIWLKLSASAELAPGLSIGGVVGKDIINTFDQLRTPSDSVLPRVRSDVQRYLQEGADGNIVSLDAHYVFQPFEDWFARVSAGLFETNFGGVGGEILYRPYGSRLAVGVDLNRVRQRSFEQRFEFFDYEVTTGHLNIYYKLPFYDLLGEIHAGQFLAGDRGAQFAISRVFDSGVRVGGWATFTNVSAEDFGEGSFDKGFFVSVPFDLFLPTSTRRGTTFAFRPLTRDGGQLLSIGKRLYGLAESGNLDAVILDWDRLLE